MPVAFQAPPVRGHINLRSLLDPNNASSGPSQSPVKPATIDLEWEPFHAQINGFLRCIDQYTLEARREVASRATEHADEVRMYNANKEEMDRRINLEREREAQMLATVDAERTVVAELQSSLSHLQSTLAKVKEQSAAIEQELNQVKRETNAETSEKERQRAMLEEQKKRDSGELVVLEEGLGIRIEGVDENVILIRFTLLDPAEPDREFSLVINISQADYSVPQCEPMIPSLSELVQQLNTDRQFYSFIKKVRKAFRALVPEPPKPTSRFDDMAGPGLRTPGSRRVLENGLQEMRLDA